METTKLIKNIISRWFVIQNDSNDGMSPEEVATVAKMCTTLDVAQVFLETSVITLSRP